MDSDIRFLRVDQKTLLKIKEEMKKQKMKLSVGYCPCNMTHPAIRDGEEIHFYLEKAWDGEDEIHCGDVIVLHWTDENHKKLRRFMEKCDFETDGENKERYTKYTDIWPIKKKRLRREYPEGATLMWWKGDEFEAFLALIFGEVVLDNLLGKSLDEDRLLEVKVRYWKAYLDSL